MKTVLLGASPRVYPRPQYSSFGTAVVKLLTTTVRWPLYAALFSFVVGPSYFLLHTWFFTFAAPYWDALAHLIPEYVLLDDLFFTFGLSLSVSIVYILENGFFYILDTFSLLQEYKLPRKPSQEPSDVLVKSTLQKEFVAHTVTAPLLMLFVVSPLIRVINKQAASPEHFPSFQIMWYTMLVCHVVNEIMFYYGHRLLHTQLLYKWIHKKHHSYVGTRSFAAEYAHEIEDVFTAYIPFLTGIFLTRAHFYMVFMWFFCQLTETYESHSGYCFNGAFLQRMGFTYHHHAAYHGNTL